MPYDPKTIYKKLAELLGGVRGDPAQSRGEYYDVPGWGAIRTTPVNPAGWDTRDVWYKDNPGGGESLRYAEGEIPEWMKSGVGFMTAAGQKGADPEDMKALARHWVYGEGVDPGYQAAFDAQPAYVKEWLKAQFAPWLGAASAE